MEYAFEMKMTMVTITTRTVRIRKLVVAMQLVAMTVTDNNCAARGEKEDTN